MANELLVNIDVDDLDRAVAFYTAAFGLTVGRRLGGGFVELLGRSSPIYLLQNEAGTRATSTTAGARRYERHWTPVHLDLIVDDLDAALRRALEAGATQEAETRKAPYGRIAVLADPFGHGFCLIEFEGRGYDELTVG